MAFPPRFSFISKPVAIVILAGLLGASLVIAPDSTAGERPRFTSTFLQIWDEHATWPNSRWDDLCASLVGLGVKEIILQWTLVTERPFFWRLSQGRRERVPHDIVEESPAVPAIVDAAERHGLRVRFGLTHDPHWWEEIKNEPAVVEVYLNRLYQDQTALAARLAAQYGSRASFAGFYIPQEIDDRTWLDAAKRNILESHLKRLRSSLETARPGSSNAISCFSNGYCDPDGYGAFWRELLRTTGLQEIYVQDGVGSGKLSIEEAGMYLKAIARDAAQAGGLGRAVVEVFEASDSKGRFKPAGMERIARQLASAAQNTRAAIIAFSLPEYAYPGAGPEAARLHDQYVKYLQEADRSVSLGHPKEASR